MKYYRIRFTLAQKNFGDAKVTDFDRFLLSVEEDVLCLEISVKDLLGMNVLK